jgi:uncharacterized phage protein (TIGR01671 family)
MRGKEREVQSISWEEWEMREIKFRTWNKIFKEMTYFDFNTILKKQDSLYSIHDEYCYSNETMQYTGLKDKNGREIYEGDIVHFIRPDLPYVVRGDGYFDTDIDEGFQLKGEVKFLYGCWFIDEGDEKGCPLEFEKEQILEVIGNIYQNKELLK